MRRPLTTDGVPFVQNAAGLAFDTIFDLTALDPAYVYAVTLFAWTPPGSGNIISAGIVTDGSADVALGIWDDAAGVANTLNAYRANGNGAAKVLDKIPMRGNQQLAVAMFTDGGSPTVWYGYFERVGVAPVPVPIRPFQPSPLVAPFNAPPVVIVSPADETTQSEVIHALDTAEQKLDFMTLYVACQASEAVVATPSCTLKVPGSVDMSIPIEVGAGSPLKIYEGVPVRQPAVGDNLFEIEVTGDDTAILTTVVYGSFARA